MEKVFKFIILSILLCTIMSMSVHAEKASDNTSVEKQLSIRYVTPDEMDKIVQSDESGVTPHDNIFADEVLFTLTRNEDGSAHVVFYKRGMLFDSCTLSGTIDLFTEGGVPVAHHDVLELEFISFTSRVRNIYPYGGKFAYAYYVLTVSDGGESVTASGTKIP